MPLPRGHADIHIPAPSLCVEEFRSNKTVLDFGKERVARFAELLDKRRTGLYAGRAQIAPFAPEVESDPRHHAAEEQRVQANERDSHRASFRLAARSRRPDASTPAAKRVRSQDTTP